MLSPGMLAAVPTIVIDVGAILAVITAAAAAAKTPPVQWLWRRLVGDPVTEWVERLLAPLHARLAVVEHEVRTNDGSSLRDVADRTEEGLARLHRRLDDFEARVPPPTS